MKKVFSKFISIVLVIVFVFGAIPLAGFMGLELPELNLFGTKAEAATSGNYTYTFYNRKATITGVSTSISGNITIPATLGGYLVTSIGDSAFKNCTGLTSVTIPDSVTTIGNYAFENCTGLTNITIGNSVTRIGWYAFNNCTGLTSVTIPDSVTDFDDHVFNNCNSLTSITVAENNQYYSNDEYGVLFNMNKTELIQYPIGNARTTYDIPNGVISISEAAFRNCLGLTSVTIPDSVTTIGDRAFENCTGLINIYIPNSTTDIGYCAFKGCTELISASIPDSVTIIGTDAFDNTGIYNDSTNWKNEVLYISNHLIKANKAISGDYIVKSGTKTIANEAFYYCDGLVSIKMPSSIKRIGDRAFFRCYNLISATLPNNTCDIGCDIFYVTGISDDTTNWKDDVLYVGNHLIKAKTKINCESGLKIKSGTKTIADSAFRDCTAPGSIKIPSSVERIGRGAFEQCDNLFNVYLENGLTYIGEYAFDNCFDLRAITIPNSVTFIGDHAFQDCSELTGVTISNSVKTIGYETFRFCSKLKSIIIPDSVTTICEEAFYACESLTSVTIPDSVTSIGDYAFYWCEGLTSVIIPNSVASIGNFSFMSCIGLTDVTIGNGVKSIGEDAFYNCADLTSVYYTGDIAGWCSINFNDSSSNPIGTKRDFYINGKKVEGKLVIPDGVKSIGNYAFEYGPGLTSVYIPKTVTSVGYASFGDYSFRELTTYYEGTKKQWGKISIEERNYCLTENIIYCCNSDRPYYDTGDCGDNLYWTLYVNGELEINGTGEMTNYSSSENAPWYGKRSIIKTVKVSDGATSIGDYSFFSCYEVTNVIIGNGVTSIGSSAFEKCTELTSVSIGNCVKSIGKYAFRNCTGLTSVYFTGDIAGWCSIDFNDYISNPMSCAKTLYINGKKVEGNLVIPDSVTTIGDYAFEYCTGLTSITIPNSVTSIGSRAFTGCKELANITIGNGVTSISIYAFSGCTGLTNVFYAGDVAGWCSIDFNDYSSNPMSYAKNLYINGKKVEGNLVITDSVTTIGNYAFEYCTGLTSVTIPDSIISIGDCAFEYCSDLSTTYYAGTPEQWSEVSIGSNNNNITKKIIFECNSDRPYYAKGACGENLIGILYTDGELVIDGIGDMTDLCSSTPWYSKRSIIKSVTIGNGVTSIGEDAFYGCTGLTSVTFGNSVTSIGEYAFYNCDGLTNVIIPDSVTKIGLLAFSDCDGLTNVTIPDSVTSIGKRSFSDCDKLKSVKIGNGVKYIGNYTFEDCNELKSVSISNGVTSIGICAFYGCNNLERVVIPHTVTSISSDAFSSNSATIVCYENSRAHRYAVDKGMNCEFITVNLSQTNVLLSVGEYSIITATPEQEYLDSLQISWKSSNPSVAAVDENGKVSALSQGTAIIFVLSPTRETLATCSVQVGYSFRIAIQNPSTKTISYKSGITLHATAENLPAGAKIIWVKDNDNFSVSDDGNGNCTIISKANGSTTFTAKVKLADRSIAKDLNGNEISAQVTIKSKAGFFDKIVAFFKGLFGGNEVLPQLFKGIF